jgi:hypothetical protein
MSRLKSCSVALIMLFAAAASFLLNRPPAPARRSPCYLCSTSFTNYIHVHSDNHIQTIIGLPYTYYRTTNYIHAVQILPHPH